MRKLAAELGVTPMALHYHFGDKRGLLLAIIDELNAHVLTGSSARTRFWRTDLVALYRQLYNVYARYPGVAHEIWTAVLGIRADRQ